MLYGRSWGAFEFCIVRNIKTFEGARRASTSWRGFLPVTTRSAHWLAHPQFAQAVGSFCSARRGLLSGVWMS